MLACNRLKVVTAVSVWCHSCNNVAGCFPIRFARYVIVVAHGENISIVVMHT